MSRIWNNSLVALIPQGPQYLHSKFPVPLASEDHRSKDVMNSQCTRILKEILILRWLITWSMAMVIQRLHELLHRSLKYCPALYTLCSVLSRPSKEPLFRVIVFSMETLSQSDVSANSVSKEANKQTNENNVHWQYGKSQRSKFAVCVISKWAGSAFRRRL